MKGTLSILGILEIHPELLDNLKIPEGLDADLLKDNIVIECAELEVLYADYSFFSYAVGVWSEKQLPVWERMKRAIDQEYNPLENYDRIEEWTDAETNGRTANTTSSGNSKVDSGGSQNHFVNGFNSGGQVMQSSDTDHSADTTTTSGSVNGTESGNRNANHNGRTHGNIGVTTSQQMLTAELDLAPRVNMYEVISRDFRNRFCLLVY